HPTDPQRHDAAGGASPAGTGPSTPDLVVLSPVEGELHHLEDVGDPTFARGIAGPGFAVDPTGTVFHAPVSGKIDLATDTLHTIGIRTPEGVEVVVHVGIDSGRQKGEGFRVLRTKGASVAAGEPLVEIDPELLRRHLPSLLTPVVIADADGYEVEGPDLTAGPGEPVMRLRRA
ncbi:MAG: glucose PTS transporter subunit IIA, partial [Brachybacterium sp.]|nr:glucose PTS transporter subunit IIA [Brachybacterium sp.]